MRFIYFLSVSVCLFFNAAIFSAAELEKTSWKWPMLSARDTEQTNPLKQLKTYLDDSGKFTLAKAEALIDQEAKKGNDILNSPVPGSECSPLQWLVTKGFELNRIITSEDKLNIAQLLLTRGVSDESVKEAFLDCEAEIAPHLIEVNTSIKKLLHSIKIEKEIEIDEVKLERLRRFKRVLWQVRRDRRKKSRSYCSSDLSKEYSFHSGLAPQAREIYDKIKLNDFEIRTLLGEGLSLTEIKEMVDRKY